MTSDTDSRRSGLAIPVLLGLMFLAQVGIANEIRYQGCVARFYDAAIAEAGNVETSRERIFDCSRVPLF